MEVLLIYGFPYESVVYFYYRLSPDILQFYGRLFKNGFLTGIQCCALSIKSAAIRMISQLPRVKLPADTATLSISSSSSSSSSLLSQHCRSGFRPRSSFSKILFSHQVFNRPKAHVFVSVYSSTASGFLAVVCCKALNTYHR